MGWPLRSPQMWAVFYKKYSRYLNQTFRHNLPPEQIKFDYHDSNLLPVALRMGWPLRSPQMWASGRCNSAKISSFQLRLYVVVFVVFVVFCFRNTTVFLVFAVFFVFFNNCSVYLCVCASVCQNTSDEMAGHSNTILGRVTRFELCIYCSF